jgi:hypothetical protein
MWNKLITVILLAGAAASGQTSPTPEDAQAVVSSSNMQTVETVAPKAHVAFRYKKLRRGHDEQIAIWPAMIPPECLVNPQEAGSSTVPYADPSSLHLDLPQGFTIRFGDGKDFKKNSEASETFTLGGDAILLKLKAARDIPPGDYTIYGKLGTFDPIKKSCPQQQDVLISFTVVDNDVAVAKNEWPFVVSPDHKFREAVGEIPLVVLFIALAPIVFIYSAIVCHSPSCFD